MGDPRFGTGYAKINEIVAFGPQKNFPPAARSKGHRLCQKKVLRKMLLSRTAWDRGGESYPMPGGPSEAFVPADAELLPAFNTLAAQISRDVLRVGTCVCWEICPECARPTQSLVAASTRRRTHPLHGDEAFAPLLAARSPCARLSELNGDTHRSPTHP